MFSRLAKSEGSHRVLLPVSFLFERVAKYYPAVSLYMKSVVRWNFGPTFRYAPPNMGPSVASASSPDAASTRPISDVLSSAARGNARTRTRVGTTTIPVEPPPKSPKRARGVP